MKIVSWNCCGAFRMKFPIIQKLNADIYVIQECENPEKYKKFFSSFFSDYVWYGEKDSKGLGIFVQPNIKIEVNNWPVYCLRHFISVKINDCIDLLGVWASPPYIEEYYIYQSINIDNYGENTLIIGDFNSNVIWDKDHGKRNHSAVVAELKAKNIVSAYHYVTGEQEGQETQSTFYLYKHNDKKYHMREVNPDFKILCESLGKSIRTKHLGVYVLREMKTENLSEDFKLAIIELCKTLGNKSKNNLIYDEKTDSYNFDDPKVKACIKLPKNKMVDEDENQSESVDKKSQIQVLSIEEIRKIAEILDMFYEKSGGNLDKFLKVSNGNVLSLIKGEKIHRVTLDRALFGSMSATELSETIPASMKVAHAFSTNKVIRENDYFTAVDSLVQEGSDLASGAAFLDDAPFNSNCYFEYACWDEKLFKKNLENVENVDEIVEKLIPGVIKLFIETMPEGKQASFAAYTPVDVVCVNIKESNVAISPANAFEIPAKASEDESLSQNSISKLVDELNILDNAFGYNCKDRLWLNLRSDKSPCNATVVNNLNELIEGVKKSISIKE